MRNQSRYHALISRFKDLTGCPVLVNTSFNVRGEPIVCSPEDASLLYGHGGRGFSGWQLLPKEKNQDPALKLNYEDAFDLD